MHTFSFKERVERKTPPKGFSVFLEETEEALLLGFLFLVVTMALFLMVFVLMVMAFLIVVMIVIMAVAFAVVVMLVLMVVMVVFVAEVAVLVDHVCEAVFVAVAVRVVTLAVIVVMVVFEAFLVDEVIDSGVVDSMEHLVGELVLVDIEDCAHEVERNDIAAGKGSVVLDTVVHVDEVEGNSLAFLVDDCGFDVAE